MNEYFLKTTATPQSSRALAKAATSIFSDSFSDEDLLHDLDLALTEACANVARHAYQECATGDLEINIRVEPECYVEVEVVDFGCGFDCAPAMIENAPPEAEGGRGLYIIKELADEFRISCEKGRNVVYFKNNIRKELWTPCD